MKKKKTIIKLICILIAIVIIITGGIFAYLTSTNHKSNIFTVGSIKISLTEPNWNPSNAIDFLPGDTINKDPKINNIGRNSAYVYLKVVNPLIELSNNTEGPLFNYTLNSGWTEVSTMDDCGYRITTYYYNTALNPNASTTSLFNSVTIADYSSELDEIQEMIINAYGIQSSYLESGSTITSIFNDSFSNNLSDTGKTCPGILPNYSGEGCANITNDSSGGGGNASMSGLTLMMKNASLGTDENIDFTLPAGRNVDNNFSGDTSTNGPSNTTTYYYTYADSYTFNSNSSNGQGSFTLTNPSVGKYSDIYSSIVGKYIVSTTGSTSSTAASSSNRETIYKVTAANSGYVDNSFTSTSYSTRSMSTTYQGYYYTYADSYTFDSTTGKFSLTNPSVGKYSDIYTTLGGKYIVSIYGSSSSTVATSTNLVTIYKVKDTTTLTSLHYQTSTVRKPITYVASSTTQDSGDNGQGVYTRVGTENDTYPIYYYRGTQSLSNNVVFGGFCWKIIRTTATGGIRMIYNGVVNGDNSCGTSAGDTLERTSTQNHITMIQGAKDGDNYTYTVGTGTTTFNYNEKSSGHKYVGYMYKTNEENDTDSNLKRVLDAWYSANLTMVDKKIEDSVYCNDRTYTGTSDYNDYCSQIRGQNGTPTTLCTRTVDAFGVASGNKKSTYKVGFLTSDEQMLAGRSYNYGMRDYLYNNNNYWTASPNESYSNTASVFDVNYSNRLLCYGVRSQLGVRPVITLKANLSYTGSGTLTDPFIVN